MPANSEALPTYYFPHRLYIEDGLMLALSSDNNKGLLAAEFVSC